jgi:hypothetical protein
MLLRAATETTYGTAPTLSASNAVMVRVRPDFQPMVADAIEREQLRPFFGGFTQELVNKYVAITFQVELAGSGAAGTPPRYGPILKACAHSETFDLPNLATSVTYAPATTNLSSCTIDFNIDGNNHRMTGCRGSMNIVGQVRSFPYIEFTIWGLYNAPTATALPAATYGAQADARPFADTFTTFSVASHTNCLASFNLQQGNEMNYDELISCTNSINIIDRRASGNFTIEAPSISTKDFFAAALATSTVTGQLVQNVGATGNIVTINIPQLDLGAPAYAERNGKEMLSLPFTAPPSSAGSDEYSIVYT